VSSLPLFLRSVSLTSCQNKELEASEERKRKAKQLEMQRKEAARSGRGIPNRTPSYPTYTPTQQSASVPDTYDAYNAEKKSRYFRFLAL
jgi:coatomer subunit delta